MLLGFTVNKSYISIFDSKYFFNDKFGIAFIQSVFVDNSFLKKYINENAVIIDVGANIGQFHFFCEHYLKAKEIYSFEPLLETYKTLQLNYPKNSFNYAITEKQNLNMFVPSTSLMSSIFKQSDDDKRESVKGVRLDDVLEIKNKKKIDLLKIDTEGSELDVLKSATQTIKKSKFILIETSLSRDSSGDMTQLICWLSTLIPSIKIVEIGRPYVHDRVQTAVDVLFLNVEAL